MGEVIKKEGKRGGDSLLQALSLIVPETIREERRQTSMSYYTKFGGKKLDLSEIEAFTHCIDCGAEIRFPDLWTLFAELCECSGDIFSTGEYCPACTRRRMRGR